MATQTFIIEASRETSVEALSSNDTDDYSSWTNRIDPIQLKRGDFISVNTAIVNQKGASGQNNIEFTDLPNNTKDNLQSNFTMVNMGFYLCNNNTNSVPLPYKYDRKQANNTNPQKIGSRVRIHYRTERFNDAGNGVQNNFGEGIYYNPFISWDGTGDKPAPTHYTCDQLSSFENRNPRIPIDGTRYAKVGNDFTTWVRKNDNILNTQVDLLTQDIPLHIEKGFKDAGSVGQTLTNILQSTNEPYSTTADDAIPITTLFTYEANEFAQTQINPRFNGYCMKSTGANLQPLNSEIDSTDGTSDVLYNSLYCKRPYFWKYGSQLLSNTQTHNLANNPLYNDLYNSIRGTTNVDYPVLLWSSYTGTDDTSQFGIKDNYDTYSPHFSEARPATKGGVNVIEWSGFSGAMSGYNDYYGEIYQTEGDDYPYGLAIYKNGTNSYSLFKPVFANEQATDRHYLAFIDEDNVAFDRILAWNPKNSLGSDGWSVKGENITRWSNRFADDFTFLPAAAPGAGEDYFQFDLDPNDPTKYVKGTIYMENQNAGTTGNKYMIGLSPDIGLEAGKKYKVRFQTTLQDGHSGGGTSSNYAGSYYIYYMSDGATTQTYQIDEDKNGSDFHEIEWTQGLATGARYDTIYINIFNTLGFTETIKIVNFQILEADLGEGDQYTITDIFQHNNTNNTSTKIYKLRVNSGQLRNEKFDITGSTIFGGIFNHQYTAYDRFTCYKSGNDIIAFDGVNSGDHDHPVIMLYQDPNDVNDYIIYNQYGSKVWRIAQITKAPNDIVSGTIVGTIVGGNETSLRNPYRGGQQYYDFSVGNSWGNSNFPIYDYSSGNDFTNITPGGYSSLRFFDTPGNAGGNIGYYDGYWTNPLNLPQRVYYRYNPPGDTTATSGTAYYTLDPIPYQRLWSFDINTGTHGTFTQTFTDGSTATYTPSGALTTTYTPYSFTSHISDPLPLIDTDKEYFASIVLPDTTKPLYNFSTGNTWTNVLGGGSDIIFNMTAGTDPTIGAYDFSFSPPGSVIIVYCRYNPLGDTSAVSGECNFNNDGWARTWSYNAGTQVFTQVVGATTYTYTPSTPIFTNYNNITYYLGANNNGSGDDTDKQGKRGRLMYSIDGGTTYITNKSWNWDGSNLIDLNGEGGNIPLTASATPTLSNIIEYETAQRNTINGVPYDFPSNGKQYGYSSVDLLGSGQLSTNPHLPLPVSSTDIDEVFLAIGDMSNFDNGYQSGGVYEDIDATGGSICNWGITFNGDGTCDLNFSSADGADEFLLLEENNSNVVRYGWTLFKSSKFDRNNINQEQTLTIIDGEDFYTGTSSTSGTGINGKYLPDGTYNFPGDTGTSKFLENQNLIRTHSNMPKHTMLLTNINYTMDNIKIIEGFFRKNEVYSGAVESSRGAISKDIDNFYVRMDLGRTEDNGLSVDATEAPYLDDEPMFQYYSRDYGRMGTDDSDVVQFTDPSGNERKGSNSNFGSISPRMLTDNGYEQRIKLFTRWKDGYNNRLIATNRLQGKMAVSGDFIDNGYIYGKSINDVDFQKNYADLYNYVSTNNVGVYPYLCKDFSNPGQFILCCAFETYETTDINNKLYLKIQDLTYFTFSPSFLDNDYIIALNPDTSYVSTIPTSGDIFGAVPSYIKEYNNNNINIGAAPVIQYDPTLNRYKWSYLHTPFRFSEQTGVDADLEEEVAFLNSSSIMIMKQGINELNLESGGNLQADPPVLPKNVHRGLADAQCGVFINDIYGQYVSDTYITSREQGVQITRENYDGTLFYYLGFSFYDLQPIRFSNTSFNNRFNQNTFNTITGQFKQLGISPFTTNSSIDVSDQQKTNIFTGVHFEKIYDDESPYEEQPQPTLDTKVGTAQYNLGYNNLLAASIKVSSAEMSSRSVIINLSSPFYRIMTSIPVDTLSYRGSNGSLACIAYMNKNYQSQSFIYSFASDYGGYLTQDMTLTNIHTEIRDPRGFKVNSIDDKSVIFYKVLRQISLENPEDIEESPEVKELKDIEKELKEQGDDLEDIEGELKGGSAAGVGVSIGKGVPLNEITENVVISIIRSIVSNTTIGAKPSKDISNKISRFFRENNSKLNTIFKNAQNDPKKLQTELNKLSGLPQLNFSATGRLLDSGINRGASISEEGARRILNVIFDQFKGGTPPTRRLDNEISKQLQAETGAGDLEIKRGTAMKPSQLSPAIETLINQVLSSKTPWSKLFKNINKGDALELGNILTDLNDIVRQYRQATDDVEKRSLMRAYINEILDVVDTRQIKLTDTFKQIAPAVLRVNSLSENLQKQFAQQPQRQQQAKPEDPKKPEDIETKKSTGGATKDDDPPPKTGGDK